MSVCYSDHAHDITTVGVCEMCGGTKVDQPGPVQPDQALLDQLTKGGA